MTHPTQAVFTFDGASVPAGSPAAKWARRFPVITRGERSDLTFVVENLNDRFGGRLAPRIQDVLAIAACCFAADREVGRTPPVDIHRERWRRELVLCIPVLDPDFWAQPEVTKRLCTALNFGTDDTWTFHFERLARSPADSPQARITWSDEEELDHPDVVALFSGGTDSLCAVVDAVRTHGAKPVLVSHWSTNPVKGRQTRLRAALRATIEGWEFPHVPVELHRNDDHDGESSQRTRGFLFAMLGAAIAAHLGISTVYLAENGYVAVNPQMNDQLVGALASRGTHPKFLTLINRLLSLVFDGAVVIRNPLWDKTRADAMRLLREANADHLLRHTYSCGKSRGLPKGKSHCGGCSQCIDRRIGALHAGLEAHDPVEQYAFDVFTESPPGNEGVVVPRSYLRLADLLRSLPAETILDERRELELCLDADARTFNADALALADVLRRHSIEVIDVLADQYRRHADRIARRQLAPNALLVAWQQVEADGLDIAVSTSVESKTASSNIRFGVPLSAPSRFKKYGKTWHLEFRTEKGGLGDREGVRRLARIMKASGARLEALDVYRGGVRAPGRRSNKTGMRQSRQGGAGEMADADAIKVYTDRRDDLKRQVALHEAAGRAHDAEKLQSELAWLDRELKAVVGLDGKPRGFPEEHERARQTVSKTVHGEMREIGTQMPMLGAHLEAFVHLGFLCWYDPDEPEQWAISS